MFKWIGFSLLWIGVLMGQAEALSMDSLRQDIDQFKQQGLSEYAPMTLARSEAYLGAAMLANDSHDKDSLEHALQRSDMTLDEAKANATRFQQQFSVLLIERERVQKILAVLPALSVEDEKTSPVFLMRDAEFRLKKVIRASELGQLNQSQNLSLDAIKSFQAAEDAALPYLEDTIRRILSKAAMKGAKRYAPVTYNKAKAGFAALKAYLDQKPEGSSKPENLVQIDVWAKQALSIANRVKTWRSDRGSHEMLVLQNQHSRHRLAAAMQLNPDIDYSTEALVKAVHQLQARLQQQSNDAQKNMQAAKLACQDDKKHALAKLQATLLLEKNTQLGDMKDAFRAKLERETFEIKRQKRLRALFPEKGVKIIVNLDGSLLVRLGLLKFGSGETKLNAQYFELLGRLKEVMDMYGDRTFRIEGHTDSLGDAKENQQLSLQRAESVRDFLIASGVDATSIKALGYGEIHPIATNEYAKGRDMNRRIDVVIEARGE